MRVMRVVMLEAPTPFLAERRRLGQDRWDEMWEGELHMVPPPHERHGRLELKLGVFFSTHWESLGLGRVYLETGVRRPGAPTQSFLGTEFPGDYRTPDLSLLLPERASRVQSGWIVGGPDVVIEIVSPGDESRAKLPFYREVGVRESILIDRDSCATEILELTAAGFEPVRPDASGWIESKVLTTEFRAVTNPPGLPLLHLRRVSDPGRELLIGE